MNPRDLELLRSLFSSMMGTMAAIDHLLNGEEVQPEAPAPDPVERRPRLAYMGDDNPAA